MARKNRTAVLKRQRERKKMEKAELKRAQRNERNERKEGASTGQLVASADDLDALGLLDPAPEPQPQDD